MVMNPDLVHYVCIANHTQLSSDEPMIVAEYNKDGADDSDLRTLAHQCVQHTPPNHLVYTHTYVNRTYTFLVEGTFVFFAISDRTAPKHDLIRLLSRLKESLKHLMEQSAQVLMVPYCFQSGLDPVFHGLVSRGRENGGCNDDNAPARTPPPPPPPPLPPPPPPNRGKRTIPCWPIPCPSKAGKGHKKRWLSDDDDRNGTTGSLVNSTNMTDSSPNHGAHRGKNREAKAWKMWRRHVWIVLIMDLVVCLILFAIWLFVCRGFRCID